MLGTERVTLLDQNTASGSSGSEDFAYISQQVPAIMLSMAAGKPEDGYIYPQHHPKVSFDENALCIGCAVHTYAAVKWLDKASE